jgi:ribosomal protein S12 methylthiotransferase accessory factor YcaO
MTLTNIGRGHLEGERIVDDAAQGVACLQRADAAIRRAITEAARVDVLIWLNDD